MKAFKVFACGLTNPVEANIFRFPGGEMQVRIKTFDYYSGRISPTIYAPIRSSDDVMTLLLLTDAVRRAFPNHPIHLICPYLPYARQDRVCYAGEALSLRVMCDLLNMQDYASIEVWDVHSDVAIALLNRATNIPASAFIWGAAHTSYLNGKVVLVSPDAGAIKRVSQCSTELDRPMVLARKIRDPNTGHITGTEVQSDHIGDKNFLIVDDICDGGRTFIELATVLRPLTNGQIHLYVTHGIFSAGFDVLRGHIAHIYTPNSFVSDVSSDFVTILNIREKHKNAYSS